MLLQQIPTGPIILALFIIVALVGFVGMLGLIAFLFSRAAKRRTGDPERGRQMQQAAGQLGLSFSPTVQVGSVPFLAGYKLSEGHPSTVENLLTGQVNGLNVAVFDLAFRNAGGAVGYGSTTSRQTMFAVTSAQLNLPEFYLEPEGMSEKLLSEFSRIDIDFPERPVFSDRYLLYGADERAIRGLFSIGKLDFFEQNQGLSVFGRANLLLLHRSRTQAPPDQIAQYVNFLSFLHGVFRQR